MFHLRDAKENFESNLSAFLALCLFLLLFIKQNPFTLLLRAWLHEGRAPQVGEVTRGKLPHLTYKRDHIKMRDYMDKRVTSPTWGPPWSGAWKLFMWRFVSHEAGISTFSFRTILNIASDSKLTAIIGRFRQRLDLTQAVCVTTHKGSWVKLLLCLISIVTRSSSHLVREVNQTQGSKHCCLFRKSLRKRAISRIFKIS